MEHYKWVLKVCADIASLGHFMKFFVNARKQEQKNTSEEWRTLQCSEVSQVLAGIGETINSLTEVDPMFSSFTVLLKEMT